MRSDEFAALVEPFRPGLLACYRSAEVPSSD
jgi:hypothetical protein